MDNKYLIKTVNKRKCYFEDYFNEIISSINEATSIFELFNIVDNFYLFENEDDRTAAKANIIKHNANNDFFKQFSMNGIGHLASYTNRKFSVIFDFAFQEIRIRNIDLKYVSKPISPYNDDDLIHDLMKKTLNWKNNKYLKNLIELSKCNFRNASKLYQYTIGVFRTLFENVDEPLQVYYENINRYQKNLEEYLERKVKYDMEEKLIRDFSENIIKDDLAQFLEMGWKITVFGVADDNGNITLG